MLTLLLIMFLPLQSWEKSIQSMQLSPLPHLVLPVFPLLVPVLVVLLLIHLPLAVLPLRLYAGITSPMVTLPFGVKMVIADGSSLSCLGF